MQADVQINHKRNELGLLRSNSPQKLLLGGGSFPAGTTGTAGCGTTTTSCSAAARTATCDGCVCVGTDAGGIEGGGRAATAGELFLLLPWSQLRKQH
jgi:hypothetical protein